jgi:hypothetical protein
LYGDFGEVADPTAAPGDVDHDAVRFRAGDAPLGELMEHRREFRWCAVQVHRRMRQRVNKVEVVQR